MSSKRKIKKCISDVDIAIMNHLEEYDELIKVFMINLLNPDISKNIIYRVLHIIVSLDPKKALEVINLLNYDLIDKSYLALVIKIYAMNDMTLDALRIYKSISEDERKKRFIIVIFNELAKTDIYVAYELLVNEIYNKFVIIEDDIKKVYHRENLDMILQIMSDNEIIIEDNSFFVSMGKLINIDSKTCAGCSNELKKFNLSLDEINSLKMNLEVEYLDKLPNKDIALGEISKLDRFLKTQEYNVFVDGNNILFFRDRTVNIDSYRRLEIIYNHLQAFNKPLFFIHRRHKNNIKKLGKHAMEANEIIKRLPIYFTPYKMNDDWFFIWAGITNSDSFVMTNDMLRDHIFKISDENIISNTLSIWMNNNIIRYDLVDSQYKLIYPKEYSVKIQKCNDVWHIPTCFGWICLTNS